MKQHSPTALVHPLKIGYRNILTLCALLLCIAAAKAQSTLSGTNHIELGEYVTLNPSTPGGSWSSSNTGIATVNRGVVQSVATGTATISYTTTSGIATNVVTVEPVTTVCKPWQYLGGSGGEHSAYTLDNTGTAWIAYPDATSGKMTVKRYSGSGMTWNTIGAANFTADSTDYMDIAVDRSGTPYVAFADAANDHKGKVMKYNGTSWVTVGGSSFSSRRAAYCKLAIDSTGAVYVAYIEYTPGGNGYMTISDDENLIVKKFDGSVWSNVGTISDWPSHLFVYPNDHNQIAFKLDANEVPYIAFTTNDVTPRVLKYNGSSWVNLISTSDYGFVSMAVSRNNNVYLSHVDGGNYVVKRFQSGSWSTIGTFPIDGGFYFSSVAVDANEIVYFSYQTGTAEWNSAVKRYNGSSWQSLGLGDGGYGTNLLIDGDGTVYSKGKYNGVVRLTKRTTPVPATEGATSICQDHYEAYSNPIGGGTWESSNPAIAGTTNISYYLIKGISTGSATITLTDGTCQQTNNVTVNVSPSITPSSAITVCVGAVSTLTASPSGGTWLSSDPTLATVGPAGDVTGIAAGSAYVSYTFGGCSERRLVYVGTTAGTLSGPSTVAAGSSITLHSTVSGGTWSASNSNATVSTSGVVTGVLGGTVTVSYTVTNSCGTASSTKNITVSIPPIVGPLVISGSGTTTLSNSLPGGAWSTGCNVVATVSTDGVVTGVSNGLATITYTTGSGYTTAVVTVSMTYSLLNGYGVACQSRTAEFIPPVGGGTWSSANTSIATTGTSGVWTGVAAGTTTISYSFGSGCASTKQVTVNPLSGYEAITVAPICEGAMGNAFPDAGEAYGEWISSDSSKVIAGQYFLGGSTSVLGVSSGTATLTHIPLPMFSCPITYASTVVTVMPSPAPITGPGTVAVGAQITLSETSTGGFWTALNPKATVDSFSGVVTGVTAGVCSIYYTWPNGCSRGKGVTVTASAAISGTLSVCEGATTTLSHATSGGTWSSGNTAVAAIGSSSGVVSGVLAGTSAITYTYSGGTAVAVVTVNTSPTAGSIGGTSTLCVASTATLSATVSGGTWSSNDATTATVSAGGVITGVAMGSVTISYNIANSCGSAVATTAVTVNPLPGAGSVTGAASVAVGSTITLSNSITGGTWSASNSNATVNSAGAVTGVTAGSVVISYSVSNSCGTAAATKLITVNEDAPTISGTLTVCTGATTTLGASISGGIWSSGDMTIATVSASGVVTGVSAGVAAITYTTSTSSASVNVTVTATPSITGTATLCPGTTTTLSGGSTGGTWTGGSTVVATVGSTGIVTGIATGTTNFTYSTGSACNATIQVTVNSAPSSITGTFKACPGTSTTLGNMTTGGSWSTSDATIATAGLSTGVISGVAAGTVTVTYTAGAGCYRTATVTINAAPAPIAGTLLICAGSTTSLTDASPGLSWTSGNTAVATVGATGVVNGVSNGMATITYTAASTNCITTAEVTVNGVPASIAGPATGCTGWDINLTNSVPGGVWSSSNVATATVDASTGVVTGVASGIVTITYTTGAGCYKTKQITINNSPSVTGYPTACVGLTTTLSGGASGTWSSSTPAVATIVTSGGYVTGVSAGTSTMTFTSTGTGCRATYVVSVIPVPSAITGPAQACTGAVLALTNSTPGGVWTSANTANATVGSATGITTIVGTGGSVTISYAFGNNCRATKAISLKPLPAVINGSPTVCTPVTTTLTTVTSGGTWTSSDASVATVGTAISASYGLVTGVSAGTAEITYTITATGCARSTVVTVNAGLNPGTITSSGGFTLHTVSPLTSVTLSSTGASGGTWTSSNPAVATINPSTGVVTAVAAGTATITYAVTASCTNITTKLITVTAGRPAGSNPAVDNVQLYPNPTTGSFTLVSEEAGTLHVFSVDGREITSYVINTGINPLSLPRDLATGIYMCRYTSESGNTTMVRLVVE